MPPTQPSAQPGGDPTQKAVLRELAAVILCLVGAVIVGVGAFVLHPGAGWIYTGALVVAGGYMLGRE